MKQLARDYQAFIEEVKAAIVEGEFAARWTLVTAYHEVGKLILAYDHEHGEQFCKGVADSVGKSYRTIRYAVQFAEQYPDINSLPEGKSISWTKVTRLLDGKNPKEKQEPHCKHCPIHCV